MMTFWMLAGIMMVVGVVLLIPALFRKINKKKISSKDLNISIYQQRVGELEEEKENGVLDVAQYEQAKLELDRTFLNDLSDSGQQGKINNLSVKGKWGTLLFVLILVPGLSAPLYLHLGQPELLVSQKDKNPADMDQNSMLSAINSLVTKLKEDPGNIDGWRLLGRSYASMNRIDDAMLAYEKALDLNGQQDPDLLVDYAEVLMSANEGDPRGFPEKIISRALLISPDHQKGLWLSGIVRYHYGDYDGTLKYWRKLLTMQQKGSEQEAFLNDNISKVLSAKAVAAGDHPISQQDSAANTITDKPDGGGSGSIMVTVSLDSKLADKAKGDEVVFIYAKAVSGPPMPLAVVRKRVNELPITVTLDDSMAMVPMARISNFENIRISAHISKTGQANKQSGDLFGSTGALDLTNIQKTDVIINQTFP